MTPRELYAEFLKLTPQDENMFLYNVAQDHLLDFVLAYEHSEDKNAERLHSEYEKQHKLTGDQLL